MRWKRFAWAGCLAPVVVGGCHTADPPACSLGADRLVAHTDRGIERKIRADAREAWLAVRGQFPRKVFTPEFRDGFVEGYADYLDRGGDAQPPTVPPPRYTQNKRYYTPEGHALIRDYYLGFKYGTDVAVATGQRQYLTVPVLLPDQPDHGPAADPPALIPADPLVTPTPTPLPTPRPLGSDTPLPKVSAVPPPARPPTKPPAAKPPAAKPSQVPLPVPGVSKFDTGPISKSDPGPAATQPVIAMPMPKEPTERPVPLLELPPVPGAVPPPKPDFGVKLPAPPAEVRSLPAWAPTPPLAADPPLFPPTFTAPPSLPANHPEPMRK